MRKYITLLFLLLFNLSMTQTAHAGSVIVLGDSLSAAYQMDREAGWVALMQQKLKAEGYPYKVINASVSGDTTQNGLARLNRLLQQTDPEVIIIELGGNDGLRGTPPKAIKRNLERLVKMAQGADAKVLLLGIQLPSNYGAAYTDQFRKLYPQIAEEQEVALVPFFMENVALVPERMQSDGIHPSAAGQPYLLDTVWPHLQPLLAE